MTREIREKLPIYGAILAFAAVAIMTPFLQRARKAEAAQESHMTPALSIEPSPNPMWCTCLKDYAALAEFYKEPR